jgi:hypothetical protein
MKPIGFTTKNRRLDKGYIRLYSKTYKKDARGATVEIFDI